MDNSQDFANVSTGVTLTVRPLHSGTRFPVEASATVQFFGKRIDDPEGETYFIASYYIDTLLAQHGDFMLASGDPDFQIDSATLEEVKTFLRGFVAGRYATIKSEREALLGLVAA